MSNDGAVLLVVLLAPPPFGLGLTSSSSSSSEDEEEESLKIALKISISGRGGNGAISASGGGALRVGAVTPGACATARRTDAAPRCPNVGNEVGGPLCIRFTASGAFSMVLNKFNPPFFVPLANPTRADFG